jgi:hypothetical protein
LHPSAPEGIYGGGAGYTAGAQYSKFIMPDPLHLNLWFPSFNEPEMMPRLVSVGRQFPFSASRSGITYVSVHPVSWSEPTVLERRFRPGLDVEQAAAIAGEFLHADYAYLFEASWDLWTPSELDEDWVMDAQAVKFIVHGTAFEEGTFQEQGHIQVDFGLDTPFLHEELELTETAEARVRMNVQKLVAFTTAVEKNCGLSGRVLWSESEENLAQKLVARIQKVH